MHGGSSVWTQPSPLSLSPSASPSHYLWPWLSSRLSYLIHGGTSVWTHPLLPSLFPLPSPSHYSWPWLSSRLSYLMHGGSSVWTHTLDSRSGAQPTPPFRASRLIVRYRVCWPRSTWPTSPSLWWHGAQPTPPFRASRLIVRYRVCWPRSTWPTSPSLWSDTWYCTCSNLTNQRGDNHTACHMAPGHVVVTHFL